MAGKVKVGTSGFTYGHWNKVFYPADVPQSRRLEYYSEHFDTVELNSSFYHMPRENVCISWRRRTPRGFCFVMKLNRLITHRKRLLDCGDLLDSFLAAVDNLGGKLGPILVQLPPRLRADAARLEDFLMLCPSDYRWAVEFRNEDWLCDEIYHVLRRHNAALVVHDLIKDHPRVVTADWIYLRYHGPGERYASRYPWQRMKAEADKIKKDLCAGRDVYAYFNNDMHTYAIKNALQLKKYVGQ